MGRLLLNLHFVKVSVSSPLPLAVFSVQRGIPRNLDLSETPFRLVAGDSAKFALLLLKRNCDSVVGFHLRVKAMHTPNVLFGGTNYATIPRWPRGSLVH